MRATPPNSTDDLRQSERRFLAAMCQLGYGRFESLQIRQGELVLDPWPTVIRSVKFGNATLNRPAQALRGFTLKREQAELLARIRDVANGLILVLEVRGGLPVSMEIAEQPSAAAIPTD